MEAISGVGRATGPSQPLAVGRRAGDVLVAQASRAAGAEPTLQRRAVEPVFRRPRLEPAAPRPAPEPAAAKAPPAPPFEWLELELIPLGRKPDPRGYAVYSQRPRPAPAPVILIETA